MKLPDELARQIAAEGGTVRTAARGLYDVQGGLGESYIAVDDQHLWLFSCPVGGERTAQVFPLAEITKLTVRGQTVFCFLDLETPAGAWSLKFSSWDKSSLDAIAESWEKQASARPAATPPAPEPAPEPTLAPASPEAVPAAPPSPSLTPLEAFCAGVHAMIECDAHTDPVELEFLARQVGHPPTIERGRALLQQFGLDALIGALPAALKDKQRRCLFANVVGVAMVDGLLRPAERQLTDRLQSALEISDGERKRIFEGLLTQHRLAVLAEPGPAGAAAQAGGLTPLVAFCAAMYVMMQADDRLAAEEQELLTRMIPDLNLVREGAAWLQRHGLEGLLARLGAALTAEQKACLMANLMAVAMADGEIAVEEQDRLEQFRNALGLSRTEYDNLFELLLMKNNLGVFAG